MNAPALPPTQQLVQRGGGKGQSYIYKSTATDYHQPPPTPTSGAIFYSAANENPRY